MNPVYRNRTPSPHLPRMLIPQSTNNQFVDSFAIPTDSNAGYPELELHIQTPPRRELPAHHKNKYNSNEDADSHTRKQLHDAKVRLEKSDELIVFYKRLKEQQDGVIQQQNEAIHGLKKRIEELQQIRPQNTNQISLIRQNARIIQKMELKHKNQLLELKENHRVILSEQRRRIIQQTRKSSSRDKTDIKNLCEELEDTERQKYNLVTRLQATEKDSQQRMIQMHSVSKQLKISLEEAKVQIANLNSELARQRMSCERLKINHKSQIDNLLQLNKNIQKKWLDTVNSMNEQSSKMKKLAVKQQGMQITNRFNKEIQSILREKNQVQVKLQEYRISCLNFQKLLEKEKESKYILKRQCDQLLSKKEAELQKMRFESKTVNYKFVPETNNRYFTTIDEIAEENSKVSSHQSPQKQKKYYTGKSMKEIIDQMKHAVIADVDPLKKHEDNLGFRNTISQKSAEFNERIQESKIDSQNDQEDKFKKTLRDMKGMLQISMVQQKVSQNGIQNQIMLRDEHIKELSKKIQEFQLQFKQKDNMINFLTNTIFELEAKVLSKDNEIKLIEQRMIAKQEELDSLRTLLNTNTQNQTVNISETEQKKQVVEEFLIQNTDPETVLSLNYQNSIKTIPNSKLEINQQKQLVENPFLKKKIQFQLLQNNNHIKTQTCILQGSQNGTKQQFNQTIQETQNGNHIQFQSLLCQLKEREDQNSTLLSQLKEILEQYRTLQNQFKEFQTKSTMESQKLKRQKHDLTLKIKKSDQQILRLEEQISLMDIQNKNLDEMSKVMAMQIKSLEIKINQTQSKEISPKRNQGQDMMLLKQNLQKQIVQLRNEIVLKNQTIQYLSEENSQHKFCLSKSQNKLAQITQQLKAKKFNEGLIASQKQLIIVLQNQIACKDQEINQMEQQQTSPFKNNDEMIQSLQNTKQELKKAKDFNFQLESSLRNKNFQIEMLNKQVFQKDQFIKFKKVEYQNMIEALKVDLTKEVNLIQNQGEQQNQKQILQEEINNLKKSLDSKDKAHQQQVFMICSHYQNECQKQRVRASSLQVSISNIMEEHRKVKMKYQTSIAKLKQIKTKFFKILSGIKIVEQGIKEDLEGSILRSEIFDEELQLSQLSQSLEEMVLSKTKKHLDVETTMRRQSVQINKTSSPQHTIQEISQFNHEPILFTPPFRVPTTIPPKHSK